MATYEKKIIAILKREGFSEERNPRGSHVVWSNGDIKVSVPAKIRKRHTANGVL